MDDQSTAAQSQAEPDPAPPPPEVTEPGHAPATEPATAQQLADVEQQMTGFETATLRWARIAVVMSGLAALFVCAQWYEMHGGATDTHTLAEAAKNQAERMKEDVEELQIQTRLDERPWLKFKFAGPIDVAIGQPLHVPIELFDFGKTAALNMRAAIVLEILDKGVNPS
jgi:cell division protein FtsL